MSRTSNSSVTPEAQRSAQAHEAFVSELREALDLGAGLRDALVPAAHATLTTDVSLAIDIERGLANALPDDAATASPNSGPENTGPGFPPGPIPIGYTADEPADAIPPPLRDWRPRLNRDRGRSRDQDRNWTPPKPEEGD
jgi:hypothetical protein